MTHRIRRLPSSILIIVALVTMLGVVHTALTDRNGASVGTADGVCAARHLAHAKLRDHSVILRVVADECVDEDNRRKAKLRAKVSAMPVAHLPTAATSRHTILHRFASAEMLCNINPSLIPHDYDPQGPPTDTV